MRPRSDTPSGSRGVAACVIGAVLLSIAFCAVPRLAGDRLALQGGVFLLVWPHPVLSLIAAMLSIIPALVAARIARGGGTGWKARAVLPLTFLPCAFLGPLLRPCVSQTISATVLYFLPPWLAAISIVRWVRWRPTAAAPIGARAVVWTGLIGSIVFTLTGVYFTKSVGPHAGDEGFYILQATTLHDTHSLDLKYYVANMSLAELSHQHINPHSRGGHLYTWHSPGICFLIAPLVPWGVWGRHAVLGLLAGIGCAGMLQLCRLLGAGAAGSWITVLLTSFGTLWGVYASRCLPEVAGASFAAWAFAAILMQAKRPWSSLVLAVATCGYLPWLHSRFVPVSVLFAGFYGLYGLAGHEPAKTKILRLAVFSSAYAAAMVLFIVVQFQMFEGGLAQPGSVLFSYPAGVWLALACDRGLFSVMPGFTVLIASALWLIVYEEETRRAALVALMMFVSVLVTACATIWYSAGACVPGRYLVVIVPLFVPFAARAFDRMGAAAMRWAVFLFAIPCFEFALMLARLPDFGRGFTRPLNSVPAVYANLLGARMNFFESGAASIVHPPAIVLLAGACALLFLADRERWSRAVLLAMGLAAVAVGRHIPTRPLDPLEPAEAARRLEELPNGLGEVRVALDRATKPVHLFDVSDRFDGKTLLSVDARAQSGLPVNDWAGRGYRWVTITAPFAVGAGPHACRLTGRMDGATGVVWAVREGSITLAEQPLGRRADGTVERVETFDCRGKSPVAILLRVDGDSGSCTNVHAAWSPCPAKLLARGEIQL